jgi:hypothetical protein
VLFHHHQAAAYRAVAYAVLAAAVTCHYGMATFAEAGVSGKDS